MAYLLPLYPLFKAGENLNVRLGHQRFPVGPDGWKCVSCYTPHGIESEGDDVKEFLTENTKLCRDCKIAWVREVGHIEYSDAFERKLGIWSGAGLLVIGICAMLLNESTGRAIWKEGDALYWITTHLAAPLNFLQYLNPVYNILLLILLAGAYLIVFTVITIITFLFCMSPKSKRHYRHMTLPMYGLVIGELVYAGVVLSIGALPLDLLLVFGPVYIGFANVTGALLFMRRENYGVVRLD